MKILHTADWHLGKRLEHFPRITEQQAVLEEICKIADDEKADAILIAGDLFDTYNPPTEAEDLFYRTLKKLSKNGTRPVIAIAGNHDSADRINAPHSLAYQNGIILVGYPNEKIRPFKLETGLEVALSEPGFIELKLPQYDYALRLLLTPYANEYRLKTFLGEKNAEENMRSLISQQWKNNADKYCDVNGVNVLMSHLYFMREGASVIDEPEDEKPILHVGGAQPIFTRDIPPHIQYTALGHLHRFQIVDDKPSKSIYSSSILEYSFSEAQQTKYVVIVELTPGNEAQINKIALSQGKKLVRKKFDDVDECVRWLSENKEVYVELTIQTQHYLTGAERKRIMQEHDFVVTIIPEVVGNGKNEQDQSKVDLDQSMEALFRQYFQHRQGQPPGQTLMDLFNELKAIDEV